jgi:tripartite-type tricarboxylate transporter receptor subunit TctC
MRAWQKLLLVTVAVGQIVLGEAVAARAQNGYPNRALQLVVTVPPGGAADFVARIVGAKLSDALGQPIVISNRAGAGGTIAAAQVAKSEPDGYTLLLNTITTHGIGPHLYANLPYDPVKDFAPIALVAKLPLIMVVNAELPAQSVNDVIALAKAKPGQLSFASSGNGGAPHLSGELFKSLTATDLLHVPYRGSGPAVVDLVAGRIAIMFDGGCQPAAPPLGAQHSDLRRARTSPHGYLTLVWCRGPRRHPAADRATAQCRAGQDSGHPGHPQELRRPGRGPQGRDAGGVRRVHAR